MTEESLGFFSIIKVDDNWLEQPVGSWEDSEDYKSARMFVHTVKTTNDQAERAIKTANDYSQILTKDEDTRRRSTRGWMGRRPQEELPGESSLNNLKMTKIHNDF